MPSGQHPRTSMSCHEVRDGEEEQERNHQHIEPQSDMIRLLPARLARIVRNPEVLRVRVLSHPYEKGGWDIRRLERDAPRSRCPSFLISKQPRDGQTKQPTKQNTEGAACLRRERSAGRRPSRRSARRRPAGVPGRQPWQVSVHRGGATPPPRQERERKRASMAQERDLPGLESPQRRKPWHPQAGAGKQLTAQLTATLALVAPDGRRMTPRMSEFIVIPP